MTNRNKAKGSLFESQVVTYLREHGQLRAARTLAGSEEDRGDISGVPDWGLQVKNHKEYKFGPWCDEAEKQAINGHNPYFAVIAKRRGKGFVGDSFVTLPLRLFVKLLPHD